MKIVFTSYLYWPPYFGGELILSIERLQSLAERGHDVTVLTSGLPSTDYPPKQHMDGMIILRSPAIGSTRLARGLRRIVFWFWMLWHLINTPCDAIHIGSPGGLNEASSNLLFWLIGWIGRTKHAKTIYVHSLAFSETDASAMSNLWHLKPITHVVGVSPALYEGLRDVLPSSAELVVNAVRDDIFTPRTTETCHKSRKDLGLKDDDIVFTFLGSVTRRKGFDVIAEAFSSLSKSHPSWKLVVVGPRTKQENQNIDPDEVEQVTQPLTGNQNVKYLGRINDRNRLADILGIADILVFPTRKEGLPLSPLEAMAMEIPNIISRIPGVTDLINIDQKTGLYVTPGSVEELEQAMLLLGENPTLRREMGKQARQRVVEAFGWEQHIDKWEALYARKH